MGRGAVGEWRSVRWVDERACAAVSIYRALPSLGRWAEGTLVCSMVLLSPRLVLLFVVHRLSLCTSRHVTSRHAPCIILKPERWAHTPGADASNCCLYSTLSYPPCCFLYNGYARANATANVGANVKSDFIVIQNDGVVSSRLS